MGFGDIEQLGVPGSSPGIAILGNPTEGMKTPRACGAFFRLALEPPATDVGIRNALEPPGEDATMDHPFFRIPEER